MNSNATPDFGLPEQCNRMGLLAEPAGYVDGNNLYEGYKGSPANNVDPTGLRRYPKTLEIADRGS